MENKILILCGTTAVGKSKFALDLSKYINMEIVSADSMQIYKTLDIGTAKPSIKDKKMCIHHMVDFVNPFDTYNVYQYTIDVQKIINQIINRNNLPVIVGGTGLYIESLIKNFEFNNPQKKKVNYDYRIICLNRDRKVVYNRINSRVDDMIRKGLVQEVKKLKEIGLSKKNQSMMAIGYKEILEYIDEEVDLDKAIYNIKLNSRNYAKRQLTWFRHMKDCEWFDLDSQYEDLLSNLVDYYKVYKKKSV